HSEGERGRVLYGDGGSVGATGLRDLVARIVLDIQLHLGGVVACIDRAIDVQYLHLDGTQVGTGCLCCNGGGDVQLRAAGLDLEWWIRDRRVQCGRGHGPRRGDGENRVLGGAAVDVQVAEVHVAAGVRFPCYRAAQKERAGGAFRAEGNADGHILALVRMDRNGGHDLAGLDADRVRHELQGWHHAVFQDFK